MLLTFPLFNNIKIIIIRHREREIVSYKMPDEIIILYYKRALGIQEPVIPGEPNLIKS